MFLAKAFQTDVRGRLEAGTLVEANYSVSVIALDREGEFNSVDKIDGVAVRSFRPVNLRRSSPFRLALGGLIFQILLVLESIRMIRALKQRPIVHAHDFNTLLPGCFLKFLRLAVGVVYDSRDLASAIYRDFYGPGVAAIICSIEGRCLRYSDAVLTDSTLFANYLRRFNRETVIIYSWPRASDIPKLSKREIRAQLGLPLEPFIISFVGSINELFPSELFLAVASLLNDNQNLQFLVVGGGSMAPEFRQASSGARARLLVLPQVLREKALAYVSASDLTWAIYLSKSLNAQMAAPLKLFESVACRVPVLAQKGTLSAELVTEMRCGLVSEGNDPKRISQSILSLSTNSDMQERLRPATGCTWDYMSPKLIETYNRLISRAAARLDQKS